VPFPLFRINNLTKSTNNVKLTGIGRKTDLLNQNMTKIVFDKNFPELAQGRVNEIVEQFRWIFPLWLQRLYVHYHADDNESSCYIKVDKDYRFSNLTICGHWINESAYLQKEQILHELIHLYNVPANEFANRQIESLCEGNAPLHNLIKSELTAKNEASTCDLTFALMMKLYKEND
jgi:hypothetical protein